MLSSPVQHTYTDPPRAIAPETSRDIQVARLLLIFGIMYIHIPPNIHFPGSFHVEEGAFTYIKLLLSNVVFIAGVPTLSLISGFLYTRNTDSSRSYGKLVAHKFKTLIIPMILVNALTYAGYLFLSNFLQVDSVMLSSVGGFDISTLVNKLLSVRGYPIAPPLYFLRDLFLCFMMVPFINLIAKKNILLLPLLGVSAYLIPIYLEPSIFLFFCLGIFFARKAIGRPSKAITVISSLFFFSAALALSFYLYANINQSLNESQLKLIIRFSGPPFFWLLITSNSLNRIKDKIAEFSKYSFLIFLLHSPLIMAMYLVSLQLGIRYEGFYFIAPWLTMLIVIVITRCAKRTFPRVLLTLNGGRKI